MYGSALILLFCQSLISLTICQVLLNSQILKDKNSSAATVIKYRDPSFSISLYRQCNGFKSPYFRRTCRTQARATIFNEIEVRAFTSNKEFEKYQKRILVSLFVLC